MKECKIVLLEGKNESDYANQINTMLRGGWKILGNFGKYGMSFIFSREIKVSRDEEEDE